MERNGLLRFVSKSSKRRSERGTVTKQDIQARLDELERDRQAHEAQINAIMGAMQDCDFWLKKIDEAEAQPKENSDGVDRSV